MDHNIIQQTKTYYTEKILQHGDSSSSVGWNSRAAQEIRFEQITKVIDNSLDRFSICDYGCGLGDYNDYLSQRFQVYDYYGYDISEEMVEAAKNKHPHVKGGFTVGAKLEADFDYLVTSGIFNIKQSISDHEWTEYVIELLHMFHEHTKMGFAFNCLTKYSDREHMKEYLYYADPLMLFDYCKRNFSRNVALLHDYKLFDFTILVRKEDI